MTFSWLSTHRIQRTTLRRADDAVNDSASKTHFIVFSKAICSFWHQQDKTVPLYSGLNSQGRNAPYEFTLAWEECCYFHNAKEMYLNILAYRTGWIRHEGMPTICKAPLKMMSHWGESKPTSYVREQSTSFIAAMLYSFIAASFNMKTGTISLVAPTWKSNIPRTLWLCTLLHGYTPGEAGSRRTKCWLRLCLS